MATAATSPAPAPVLRLFEVASRASGVEPGALSRLGQVLTNDRAEPRLPGGFSDLNWNGSPLQVLLSCGAAGLRTRLLADPVHGEGDPIARLDGSLQAMEQLLVEGGATALRASCWEMLQATLPRGDAALGRYPTGMLRLAIALGAPGVAVYAGAQHDRELAWSHAAAWLDAALPDPHEARALVASLSGTCRLFGVAVEGTSSRAARLKLYWRLAQGAPRDALEVPLLGEPPVLRFLADVMSERSFPLTALTFSASFAPASGALEDVKVDVCNRSALLGPGETARLAERYVGLDAPGATRLATTLADLTGDVAIGCVGLGLDRRGGPRFNVYVFPVDPTS